jgi:fumarylacetoacetate (FAA) hydrolase family protein
LGTNYQLSTSLSPIRSKGAAFIVSEAHRSIHDLQKGIEAQANTINEGARSRLGGGVRRMQARQRCAAGSKSARDARAFLSPSSPSHRRRRRWHLPDSR